jgi:hypothetical protein
VNKARGMRWAGHVARMGDKVACRVFTGRPEGKRPLGRTKSRLKDIIKWIFQEV